jgi:copper/silver efflux system protein
VLNPDALRAYGLSTDKVKDAIQAGNNEVGGSVIEMAEAEYMVRSDGYIHNLNDLGNIPLGVSKLGTPILLKDVATIQLGPQPRRGVADLNGEGETVGGIVVMRYGQNALTTIDGVRAKLTELKNTLPKGVEIVPTYDRSSLIHRAVETLDHKLIEELIIVLLVCGLFLAHLRSSLVLVVSLPLGILGAFVIMQLQGLNANIMSLGGIAIAIGAMVDAAIVMIENLHRHFEQSPPTEENRWQVVAQATAEVGPSLFFSLLIIALSFVPIFSLTGEEGRLFSPLAFTKTYAMAVAAGLSITLVPVLMGYFVRGRMVPEGQNPVNRALIAAYRPCLRWALEKPWTVIGVALVVVLLSIVPAANLGSEFMPELNEGDLLYMPTTLPGVGIGEARHILQQTDKLIATMPEVQSVFGKAGRADTATDPAPLSMIETVIQLEPEGEWPNSMTMDKLKTQLNQLVQFPGLTNTWLMPIRTRIDMLSTGIKTPVGIKISGPDLKVIQALGEQVEAAVQKVPGTASAYSERTLGGRYLDVDIDRVAAARFGMSIDQVQSVVDTAVGGDDLSWTVEGLERYPINLRYPEYIRGSLQKLEDLPITTPTGATIPLSDMAAVRVADGPDMVRTESARPTGYIYVDTQGRDLGSYVADAQRAVAAAVKLPAGYSISWSGQFEYLERAKERLKLVVPLTLIIIVLLLYLNFRRISDVLIILMTVPLSLTGGVLLLWALGYHLSVAVAVGFIALAGVATEIGVIMMAYLNHAWDKRRAEGARDGSELGSEHLRAAVMEGAALRVRPVIMTVTAILAGLLPIMLGSGTGSEVMRRIAAPMVGGMVSVTVLALFAVPAVYYLWHRRRIEN